VTTLTADPEPPPTYLGSVTSRAGVPIYVDLRDERARRLIAAGGNFNPPTLAMWHSLINQDRWTYVIDIGANYGEMLANGGLPRGARIIAVEPNPRVRPFLRKTLSALEGVELLDVALSDRDGKAEFLVHPTWSGMSRIVPDGSGGVVVPTTTLGSLLSAAGLPLRDLRVLVKIDVEGHEIAILHGVMEALPQLGNFAALIEVAHMSDAERDWITQRFAVFGLNIAAKRLQKIERLDAEGMRSSSIYDQDAVILRKGLP
jgi:FkbM family methyltransferase